LSAAAGDLSDHIGAGVEAARKMSTIFRIWPQAR
jgi:hypothetical protein